MKCSTFRVTMQLISLLWRLRIEGNSSECSSVQLTHSHILSYQRAMVHLVLCDIQGILSFKEQVLFNNMEFFKGIKDADGILTSRVIQHKHMSPIQQQNEIQTSYIYEPVIASGPGMVVRSHYGNTFLPMNVPTSVARWVFGTKMVNMYNFMIWFMTAGLPPNSGRNLCR
jgi:hypothetical protein